MSSSSSSSNYSHSSSSTSTSSVSSSSHISSFPDVYYTDPTNNTTHVLIDDLILFKVTDTTFGLARNTIDLLMGSESILTKGELQNSWTLSAYPSILNSRGVDISSGKCNWGSFDGSTDSSRYYDVFEDANPDWDSDLHDSENSRRWYRIAYGDNTTITYDAVNDAVDIFIDGGLNEHGYLLMSGEGIGEETSQGGSPVFIEGDFEIIALFDIVSRSILDTTAFAFFLTKDLDPIADKVIIERFNQPSIPEDGFASAQSVSVTIPPQVATYDYAAVAPVDLLGNGFKVTRIVDVIKTYYTIDGGGSWNLLGDYTWTEDDLFLWMGAFIWNAANTLRVRLSSFEMVSGSTNKTRDISYNLVPPADFIPGKLNLFDFYGENYRGGFVNNRSWWFYTAPGTIVVDNLFPARNSNNVATDTNVSFDLSIPNDGISMNSLDVELNIETACEQVRNYDYAILKGVEQTGYTVTYAYSDLNRILVDRFYETSIDIYTRWAIGAVGTWTQNEGVSFSSGAGTGESKLYSGGKGVIQGDFDIVMDAAITIWPTTDAYVALEVDDRVNRIRVGRTVGPAKDVWRCEKDDSIGGHVTNVVEVNTSTLNISGVRLKRLNGSNLVDCYYLSNTPDWGWILLGSIPLSTNDVRVSLVAYNSAGGDPLGVTFTSVETLKGTGTFPGKISVAINPDSSFYEDALPSPRINVRSWAESVTTDYVWPFWIQALGTRNIKFWYPAVNPQDQLSINHGVDTVAPNLQLTKFSRMNETSAGVLIVRNLGYEEEQINLSILLATKCEVDNFKEFFFNAIKGKSRIFHYENYVTGDSANVRLLSDTIPIGVEGGHPYSVKMTLRKESVSSSTSSTSSTSSSSSSSSSTSIAAVAAADAGEIHGFALGSLYGWGNGATYKLGLNNTTNYNSPQEVDAGSWLDIAAGRSHSGGIKSDGTLWTWGNNTYGGLGNGALGTDIQVPTQIGVATDWTQVECGGWFSLFLNTDDIYAAGRNNYAQCGQGDVSSYKVGLNLISIGITWDFIGKISDSTAIAVSSSGQLYTWGSDLNGAAGYGNAFPYYRTTPYAISGLTSCTSAASGYFHSMCVNSGVLWGTGSNVDFQIGLGIDQVYSSFTQVGGDSDWADIACGEFHSMALKTDGTMYCTGLNTYGQLGTGDNVDVESFTQVGIDSDWANVYCGQNYTLAVKTDGSLWSTGRNNSGQLGIADWVNKNVFTEITL